MKDIRLYSPYKELRHAWTSHPAPRVTRGGGAIRGSRLRLSTNIVSM